MKEIRLNKIGFNILADTDNVCYALLLKDWQLQQNKGWQPESAWEYIVGDLDSELKDKPTKNKPSPCFSLQQSTDPETALVKSPRRQIKRHVNVVTLDYDQTEK